MITKHPLVLNLTNTVTIDFVANALLAVGASPVMSEDPEDAFQLAGISQAIAINIGTTHDRQMKIIERVLEAPIDKKFVLDPVGVGATSIRTEAAFRILKSGRINLIRGNASEIASLAGTSQSTRGVDSTVQSLSVQDSAVFLANKYNSFVVVSGEVDILTDGKKSFKVFNGSSTMPKITGTGCVLSAYLAAILGDGHCKLEDLTKAVAIYGCMGEVAERSSQGTGSFKIQFLDALSKMNSQDYESSLRMELI